MAAKRSTKTKDATLAAVVGLLAHEEASRRLAAAIVMTEVAPSDAASLDALRAAVTHPDDPALREQAAHAIGAIAPKTIVDDLRPLLRDPETHVREAAKTVLASGRGVTAEDVARMLESKDDKQRVSAIAVLGAMGTPEARTAVLGQLEGGSPRILEACREAMVPLLEALQGAEAQAAADEIADLLDPSRVADDAKLGKALVALLEAVKSEAAAEPLLRIANRAGVDEQVRASACTAMRSAVQGKKPGQRVFGGLLELVSDKQTPKALLGPACDTLATLDVPLALEPKVRSLVVSEESVVRRWALRGLGKLDTAPAAKALAEVAVEGDATDRQVALEAALATETGRTAIARRLGKITDPDRAERLAEGLRPHLKSLSQATLHHLEESALDAPPEVAGVIMRLFAKQNGGGGRAHDGLFDKAMKLKKDGRWQDAAEIFRRMAAGSVDPEVRFQLGVCELRMSKRKVARGGSKDPCVETIGGLGRVRSFPLVERLQKEPEVTEDDLYYLGFSLAEGSSAEQGVGGDLLLVVAEAEPASKLNRMARNKLATMGWME